MKLTPDENRALTFVAGLLCLSAAVRIIGLPEPVEVPDSAGLDLAAHIEAVEGAVAEAEEAARPLEPGETVDPNTASEIELMRLPRIGPAMAGRIVADREANGPYRRLEDLGRVSGVGERTLETLAPHLALQSSPAVAGREPTGAGRTEGDGPTEGPVDLNRAGVDELAGLPGIGPVLAARIVAYRDSAGPFATLSDLTAVKGIGSVTVERLRARALVRQGGLP